MLSTLFLISLVAYFVFAATEEFIPGFVSNYLNPQWLLIPVVGFLIAALRKDKESTKVTSLPTGKTAALLIFFAAVGTLGILWVSAAALEQPWRILVAVYGGVLVTGMLSVLLKE